MSEKAHLVNFKLNNDFPQSVRGEGVYLYDRSGKQYLDGCSGALVANLGHGVSEITRAMAAQADDLAYIYRFHFSCPAAEELADRYCHLTNEPMGMAYFANSGSEATESAVKLARVKHLASGEPNRYKVISRWQSYHGITMGALSWSGYTARRADFQPYINGNIHIAPAYCYRCWFGQKPDTCSLECAGALETAILTEGPETVSAFLAEVVSGSSLAAANPPAGYFEKVREICDRYGVLYIAEEVMTGAGRTGGKFFASDHYNGRPDAMVFGKGVGAGYYPLSGVLISRDMAKAMTEGPGVFAPGQSYAGHPVGMAAGLSVLDFMEKNDILAHAAEVGEYMGKRLMELLSHPSVGDVRGKGLIWGLEFVKDKDAKATFDPKVHYYEKVYEAARERGLLFLPTGGCDRGQAGDMALFGPPLTITRPQIDELTDILDDALTYTEKEQGL